MKTFQYFGVSITNTEDRGPEVKGKIKAETQAFHSYKNF